MSNDRSHSAAACLELEDEDGEPFDGDDFELFDDGHSMSIDHPSSAGATCVMDQLGCPIGSASRSSARATR